MFQQSTIYLFNFPHVDEYSMSLVSFYFFLKNAKKYIAIVWLTTTRNFWRPCILAQLNTEHVLDTNQTLNKQNILWL